MFGLQMIKQPVHVLAVIFAVCVAFNSIVMPSLGESPVYDQSSIIAIDINMDHALALMSNGTVWAWGSNLDGQCGINITNESYFITRPVRVPGISDVKAIASGEGFSLALKNDGTVWAWGSNHRGEMGIGISATLSSSDIYPQPTQVQGLNNVIAIDAGSMYALALRDDGTVWAWGQHGEGTLGDGRPAGGLDDSYFSSPTRISGLENIKSIYAGPVNAMALAKDGRLWAWGHGSPILGERQFKYNVNINSTPDVLSSIEGVKSVAMGTGHVVVLKDDGTVWTWGNNLRGKFGSGSDQYYDVSYTPIAVPGLTNITAIAAGIEHTVALKDDGTVWAWGGNTRGQIGDGTNNDRNKPVKVPISNVATISAGGMNTMTLDKNGVLEMSGDDCYGQLGDGIFGNGLNKSSFQPVDFGHGMQEPGTPGHTNLPENSPGVPSQEPLDNNVLKIAALLVIIVIIGSGVLFYIKKR